MHYRTAFPIKTTQPWLKFFVSHQVSAETAISFLFGVDQAQDFKYATLAHHKTVNKGHGRTEVRECWSTSNPEYLRLIRGVENWLGLRSIAMVICTRIIAGKESRQVRFMSPACPAMQNVYAMWWANIGRSKTNSIGFWMWPLNEDHCRVRKDQSPENFAVMHHIALNLLKQKKTAKGGTHARQLQAAWNQDYLLKILRTGL